MEQFATYSILIAILNTGLPLAVLGLNVAILKDGEIRNSVFGDKSIKFNLLLIGFVGLFLYVCVALDVIFAVLLAPYVVLFQVMMVKSVFFQVEGDFLRFSLLSLVPQIVRFLSVALIFFVSSATVYDFLLVKSILSFVLLVFMCRRELAPSRWGGKLFKLAMSCSPYMVFQVFSMLSLNAVLIVCGGSLLDSDVASLSICLTLFSAMNVFSNSIFQKYIFVIYDGAIPISGQSRVLSATFFSLISCVVLSLVFWLFSDLLVSVVFGDKYQGALEYLGWFLLIYPVKSFLLCIQMFFLKSSSVVNRVILDSICIAFLILYLVIMKNLIDLSDLLQGIFFLEVGFAVLYFIAFVVSNSKLQYKSLA